jgi:Zn finger protein HypA/HybF involved in hydrogenase expression
MKQKKKKTTETDMLQCKYCDTMVQKAWENVTAVTCWKCTHKLVEGEELEIRK